MLATISQLREAKKIHLIAICGTGMGSLAGLFKRAGFDVQGSDNAAYPPMSLHLKELGIKVREGYCPSNLDYRPDVVIIGNACRVTNPEVEAAMERGIPYYSFPQALGAFFLAEKHPVVITGTHGKTTTSALTSWLLEAGGASPGFLIGGITGNFNAGYQLGGGRPFVVEGDEYDTAFFDKGPKFLHYRPLTAVITGIEFDHADIYSSLDEIETAFDDFVQLVPEEGLLIVNGACNSARLRAEKAVSRVVTYGLRDGVDWQASEINFDNSGVSFILTYKQRNMGRFHSPLMGRHNIENALAAIAATYDQDVDISLMKKGLKGFGGVKRRLEIKGKVNEITVIDDFAHHPTAVVATIEALRRHAGESRIWSVFEPRTNSSRRNIFQERYAESFDLADRVIIAPPHNQEAIPSDERMDSSKLVREIRSRGIAAEYIEQTEQIAECIAKEAIPGDLVLIMSNGDFDGLHAKVLTKLRQRGS